MSYEFMQRMLASYSQVHNERYWDEVSSAVDAEFLKDGSIADLGCGPGLLLKDLGKRYLPSKLIGVDLSDIMLDQARKELSDLEDVEIELIKQHLQEDPILHFKAHAIFSSRVMRSFEEQMVIMNSLRESLHQDGYLVILDWVKASISHYASWFASSSNGFKDLSADEIVKYHRNFSRYDLDDWDYILTNAGFEVVHSFQVSPVHCCIIGRRR